MPKKDAAQRLTVSSAEITALMAALERLPSPRRVDLARALLCTFVYTGVRFQELLDIRVQDVNLAKRTLLVASGTGSKSRLLYPPPPCIDAIAPWMKRQEPGCTHDWLFAYDLSRRIGEEGVRQLLEDIKAIAGLRGVANIKPHSLRHAFATRMMKNGAPLKAIQHPSAIPCVQPRFSTCTSTKIRPSTWRLTPCLTPRRRLRLLLVQNQRSNIAPIKPASPGCAGRFPTPRVRSSIPAFVASPNHVALLTTSPSIGLRP